MWPIVQIKIFKIMPMVLISEIRPGFFSHQGVSVNGVLASVLLGCHVPYCWSFDACYSYQAVDAMLLVSGLPCRVDNFSREILFILASGCIINAL
jgi:hypothetical protein